MAIAKYASKTFKTPVVYNRMKNPNPSRQKQQTVTAKARPNNELRGSKVELGSPVRLQSARGKDLKDNQKIRGRKKRSWTLTDSGAALY